MAVLKLIGRALLESSNAPRASESNLQLVNHLMGRDRVNGASSKDDVANRVYSRIRVVRVGVLPVIQALFLNKQFGNLMAC